jgi:phytoene synthase
MNKIIDDFEICRQINKKYGKSYYFSTFFFPKNLRFATYALYAFFRLPDEIVDSSNDENKFSFRSLARCNKKNAKEELKEFNLQWQNAYQNKTSDNPVLRATAYIFHEYQIPFEYSQSFLLAMIADTKINRYKNYTELKKYMYGSAAVVGLIMTHVIGFNDKRAIEYAQKLGYAMQMTNFLRDIAEDYDLRNRIYMPLADLEKFHLNEKDIAEKKFDENFIKFMKFQIERTRQLYREANYGIKFLLPAGRLPVKIASLLYSNILNEIEKMNYNIFTSRAKVSFGRKIILAFYAIIKKNE